MKVELDNDEAWELASHVISQLIEEAGHERVVANVALAERGLPGGFGMPGGQVVHNDRRVAVLAEHADHVRSNVAGASCDDDRGWLLHG